MWKMVKQREREGNAGRGEGRKVGRREKKGAEEKIEKEKGEGEEKER